jgi:hypothetical protein
MRTASLLSGGAWRRALLASALVVSAIGSAACEMPAPPGGGGGDIGIFEANGRCTVASRAQGAFTLFTPTGGTGCTGPFPVVGWGNGSFTGVGSYTAFLTNVASHGFTVVAANTSNANGALGGGGQTVLDDALVLGRGLANVGTQACTMGYSQGGAAAIRGALIAGARCAVGIAAEINLTGPASATGLTRVIVLGGGADTTAPVNNNSMRLFTQAGAPKALGVLTGVGHLEPLGNGGRYRGFAIAALVLNLRPSDPDFAAASRLYNNDGIRADGRVMTFTRTGTF